ncbi:transcriptional antiterminator [Enterococcus florum]|uniref:Transcriptional antiterminator n=1 Tax=Enterococcus florum TaxID=2480627 RepID=A0A4P5P7U6_9ENTE|nr:PRD domain-containing protein [Enterococcus florum]GCF92281.1 transcriptional antiterminator [Enterococcus florum]
MMQLSKREIKILLKLLDSEKSVTTKELSDQFLVSVRTVKYDLDNIRLWLYEREIELHAQRSKGFWFELTETQRIALKNELIGEKFFDVYLDQKARIDQITLCLLFSETVTTAKRLADSMDVSKNTIMTDLEKVEEFAFKYGLVLKRQSGQGFWLEGTEEKCRFLMDYLLHHSLTEYDIYQIMHRLTDPLEPAKHPIHIGKGLPFYEVYQLVIDKTAELLAPNVMNEFNYAELLAITFRVAIATSRLLIHKSIGSFTLLQERQTLLKNQDIPMMLMELVFSHYGLPILRDEYEYICSDLTVEEEHPDTLQLSIQLIDSISKDMNVSFDENPQLLTNLFAHLSLRLGKKHLYLNEYNPFIDDIKGMHPALFSAIKKACRKVLPSAMRYLINDSFISYIALHFMVHFEKEKIEQGIVRIVYVCSTGLGVTSLIQQKIEEEISNVEIVSFASVLNAVEMIRTHKPDLVVSIFPIEGINCPLIKVNAIPSREDIEAIKEFTKKTAVNRQPAASYVRFDRTQLGTAPEEATKEVILKGFILYEGLRKLFAQRLKKEIEDAFLLHVFLMVHRIIFKQQYELEGNVDHHTLFQDRHLFKAIEQLFSENDLAVNEAELTALFNYVDKKSKEERKGNESNRRESADFSEECLS